MMQFDFKDLKLTELAENKGQIPDVPQNPRYIREERFNKLVQNLEALPELLKARPLIVFLYDGKYVILAGNQRYKGAKELKLKTVPCAIVPQDTAVETLRRIVLLDNENYGQNDFDILANEFEVEELEFVGVEVPNIEIVEDSDEFSDEFSLKEGDRPPFQQMTFTLSDAQATELKNLITEIKKTDEFKYMETDGNENSNGNALYLICKQWAEQKTLF